MVARDAGGETERRLHLSASSQHWHLWKAGNEGVTVAWGTLSPGVLQLPSPNTQSFDQGRQQSPGPTAAWRASGETGAQILAFIQNSQCACSLPACATSQHRSSVSGVPPLDVLMRQTLGSKDVGEQTCYLRPMASPLEEAPPVRGGIHSMEVHGVAVTTTWLAGGLRSSLH